MDAGAAERSRVGGGWIFRMGDIANDYVLVHNSGRPNQQCGHYHDRTGVIRRIYRRRRYCDIH